MCIVFTFSSWEVGKMHVLNTLKFTVFASAILFFLPFVFVLHTLALKIILCKYIAYRGTRR